MLVTEEYSNTTIQTLILDKVPVDRTGRQKPTRDNNLLWNVNFVPNNNKNNTNDYSVVREGGKFVSNNNWNGLEYNNNNNNNQLCQYVLVTPAYLFVFDEEDGYRLNWIYFDTNSNLHQSTSVEQYLISDDCNEQSNNDKNEWNKLDNLIVDVTNDENSWQNNLSNRLDGSKISTDNNEYNRISDRTENQMKLSCSAFLSVKALLHHLLIKFPNLAPKVQQNERNTGSDGEGCSHPIINLPNYTYDLVSVTDGGRMIEILLVFSLPGKKVKEQQQQRQQQSRAKSVGVFVQIDVLKQQYKTINWLRSNFSVDDDNYVQISHLVLERRRQFLEIDTLPSSSSSNDVHLDCYPSDDILLSLLYPDTQTFDNAAVRKQRPVYRIQARASPVELYYG